MRIGVDGRSLVNPSGRGVAHYTRSLLIALADAYPDDDWRVLVPSVRPTPPIPGIHLVRVSLPSRFLYGLAAAFGRPRLDSLLGGVDVFWAPAPAPLALSSDVPFVLTLHDLSWEQRPGDFTRYERLWHRIARPDRLAARAAQVMADSEDTRVQAIERWRLAPERVTTVTPTVTAPARGLDPHGMAAVRRRHGLPPRYFLWVGALEPRKAPDVLAHAFDRARAAGLDADLVIVGQGRLRSVFSGPGVKLLDRVSSLELDHIYAGALALVMPSRLEGFGLPPLEAALLGTPSILTDLPVFRETLGEGALRVAIDDEAALAAGLMELAADAALRDRLSACAAAMARRFTPERAAHEVYSVLAEAVRGR